MTNVITVSINDGSYVATFRDSSYEEFQRYEAGMTSVDFEVVRYLSRVGWVLLVVL